MHHLHLPHSPQARAAGVFAIVAAVVAAVLMVLLLQGAGDEQSASVTRSGGDAPVGDVAAPASRSAGGAGAGQAGAEVDVTASATVSPGSQQGDVAAPAGGEVVGGVAAVDPRIVRTASLDLRVDARRFDDAVADARRAASAMGGYVAASQSTWGGGATRRDAREANITLRVPAARYEEALDRVRGLGTVRAIDETSQDVTREYVDTTARLRHARALERRLTLLMGRTTTIGEALSVQARLDTVQERIEVQQGRIRQLRGLTELSTIEMRIATPAARPVDRDKPGALARLGASLREAGDEFVEQVGDAIVAMGTALPTLLLLGLAAIAARIGWRRHRKHAKAAAAPAGSGPATTGTGAGTGPGSTA